MQNAHKGHKYGHHTLARLASANELPYNEPGQPRFFAQQGIRMDPLVQIGIGLALLAAGGEGLIRGAVSLARRFGMSELMIGLTLVGFGTSTPELVTSIDAALAGSPGIALGNVIGSNISNVLLIFGLIAFFAPIAVKPEAVGRDAIFAILVSVALAAIATAFGILSREIGLAFIAALLVYTLVVFRMEKRRGGPAAIMHEGEAVTHEPVPGAMLLAIVLTIGGFAILIYGADMLVSGAVALAQNAGISETVIGLTIVAVGTSLPELVVSLVAVLRGRADVAFGNIVGSNIYNVLGILGISSIITPITIPADIGFIDWSVLLLSALLLLVFARTDARVSRQEGATLLMLYAAYTAWLLWGQGST